MVNSMRVLIGFDGSDCSIAAVRELRRAGLPEKSEAMVLSVADIWPSLPASACQPLTEAQRATASPAVIKAHTLACAALDEAKETAKQGADLLRGQFSGWTIASEALADSPYRAIVSQADKWRPDLIVVGSHGRSTAGRMLLGSVATNVLSHAICSVRVARIHEDASRPAGDSVRILLGVDGSADSATALSAVASRVWPRGTSVHVVAAIDLRFATAAWWYSTPDLNWAGEGPRDETSWARRAVEGAIEELTHAGLNATGEVIEGDPKHMLLEIAQKTNSDCIFLGAKGHSKLDRFLLGSVSSAIASRAKCSVEVVR